MNQLIRFCASSCQAILLTLLALSAFGQTVYVSTTGTETNPALASSWSNALAPASFPAALTAASSGTIFYLAGGLYTPTTTPDRSASFSIASGVEVYGGYTGNGTPGPRTAFPSSTTLSGEIGDLASTTDNSKHVVQFRNASASTRLDGFVITGGRATNDGGGVTDYYGGGLFNDGQGSGNQSNPLLTNVLFSRNYAFINGGAIFNYGVEGNSSPVLINVCFSQNYSDGDGGAMYNNGSNGGNSSPVLINMSFSQNYADEWGGGIINNGNNGGNSSPVLTNVSFSQNSARFGGAIYNGGNANPVLINGVFFGNTNTFYVFTTQGAGGATLTASYSLFDGASFISGPGNVSTTTSPFVDANAGNLQLRNGAEAIDAGISSATGLAGISTDLAGNSRLVGCRIDMGAFESPYSSDPNPQVFTQTTANGLAVQVDGGVSYERLKLLDRINGYEVRGTEINQTGYFLIQSPGPYSITVIAANGCRAVVMGMAP